MFSILPEVLHDRAFDRCTSFERPIAHLEVLLKRLTEGVEFISARFQLRELSRGEGTDMTTARAPRVRLMIHEMTNVTERQAMRLCLFDEPDAIDSAAAVLTKPAQVRRDRGNSPWRS